MSQRNDFVAQVCHICATSADGPRYNPEQTDEERRAFENLIILCYPHHVEVDAHVDEFTVERLANMKKIHEARVREFAPSPEAVLQAVLQPNVIHSLPPHWLSALAARSALRCLPLVAGGPEPFRSFGPRTYLATGLIGVGVLAYAMTLDSDGTSRRVANVARLLAYGAGGKLTPNAPPPGAVDAATAMARANVTASLGAVEHYGTSIDARAAMRCSVQAMPESLDQLQSDLAIASAPGVLALESFLLSPLWEPGGHESWRARLDVFANAVESNGGGVPAMRVRLAAALRKLTVGALSRTELDSCVQAWSNGDDVQARLRAEDEASRR